MTADTIFDYFYGDESNMFSFYRIPRQLIVGEEFRKLSTDAKLLYGLFWTEQACLLKTAGMMNRDGCIFITP